MIGIVVLYITFVVLYITFSTAFSDVIPMRYNITFAKAIDGKETTGKPFVTIFSYTQILDEDGLFYQNMDKGCYHNEQLEESEKNYEIIKLRNPKITHFKVLDTFYSSRGEVKVKFYTTWDTIENDTFSDRALDQILTLSKRFTLKIKNDPDSVGYLLADGNFTTNCKNKEYYLAPSEWCRYPKFFKDKIVKGGSFMFNNQCVINYETQNENFISMWKAPANTHFRRQCLTTKEKLNYNDWTQNMINKYSHNYSCIQNKTCSQNFYKVGFETNGMGDISKLVIGVRRNNSLDLNFTITFKKWTFEFVEVFCNAYAFCDIPYNDTTLEILINKPNTDKPDDDSAITLRFLVWVLFMFVPAFMITTTLIFCVLTRSRSKGFVLSVWQYWKKKNYNDRLKPSNSKTSMKT